MPVLVIFMIFIGLLTTYFLHSKINTPLTIFTIAWLGTFLLSNINLLNHTEITNEANLIIVGSYIIFYLGYVTSGLCYKIQKPNNKVIYEESKQTNIEFFKKALKYSIIILLLAFFIYLLLVIRLIGVSGVISGNPYLNRLLLNNAIPSIYSYIIISLSIGGTILICLLMASRERVKLYYYFVLIPPLGIGFITGQRILGVYCLVTLLVGIVLFYDKLYNKRRLIISIASLSFFFFILAAMKRGNVDDALGGLEQLYRYTTSSFAAFSEALRNWDGVLQYGENMFLPLFKLFKVFLPISVEPYLIENRPFIEIPYLFNVYTYLWDTVNDFGYLGLVLIPYILGIISNYLFNSYKLSVKKNTTFKVVALIAITSFLFYSFISSLSTLSSVWYGYIYVLILIFLSKSKKINVRGIKF